MYLTLVTIVVTSCHNQRHNIVFYVIHLLGFNVTLCHDVISLLLQKPGMLRKDRNPGNMLQKNHRYTGRPRFFPGTKSTSKIGRVFSVLDEKLGF